MTSAPRECVPPLTDLMNPPAREGAVGDRARAPAAGAHASSWSTLMAEAQTGNGAAYHRLLEEILPYLRGLVLRRHRDPGDVEDALQDILLTVHAIRYTYDPARPFGPWLATIADRRLIDRLRRQGRLRSRECPLAPEHDAVAAEGRSVDEEMSDRRELKGAIENLPARQREAIELLKLKEMSLKEAADRTGISVGALKVATHRALESLRRMLIRGGPKP